MKKKRANKPSANTIAGLLASLMFMNFGLCCGSTALATEVFVGGQDGYGASINDLGGATINYNTGKEAQIGGTGNGNVITWDYMNVGKDNKLDFNFTQSGQVILNKVQGGVSKFAGNLSTSGENGHLVISNPNGMVFMDGSVTNVDAGSATFTTHDATWDRQKNGNITTNSKGTIKGITIGGQGGPVPVFRVNKDLNLIAPGIDVSGADLFAGGAVRMVSADGVNFVAGANSTAPASITTSKVNPAAVQYARVSGSGAVYYTSGNANAINVKNTNVSATKSYSVDGHLYLVADGDISINNLNTGAIDATSNKNITIAASQIKGGTNSTVTAKNLNINSSGVTNTALKADNINTSNWTYLHNIKADASNSINIQGGEIDQNSVLSAKDINIESATLKNTELKATNGINTLAWTYMFDVNANAGGNISIAPGAGLYNTVLKSSGGNIDINQTYLNSVTADAQNGEIKLTVVNAEGDGNKIFNAKDITIMGGILDKITATATEKMNIVGAGIYKGSKLNARDIDVTYGANIQNAEMIANNNISVDGTTCALYLNNVVAKAVNGDINIKNTGGGHGLGIENSQLSAGNDINIANSQLTNMKPMDAKNLISITNSTAKGNLTATSGKDIKVNGLNADANVKLMASDTIDIKNINSKGTVSALNAENIVADTVKGNLVYLGGRTKDKAQPGISIGNSAWYEEWNPMAKSIVANNIEADLDLRLLSTDKVVANGLTSGGDIHLVGNNVTASNINVTDQKIKTHFPSTNTTTGLIAETYDSWASGWGLASNGGKDSTLTLNDVNIADKAAAVQINAFETVNGKNIAAPMFIAESVANVSIDGLKVDDIHFSNLYYTLFGNGYFDLENVNIKNLAAFTQGRDVTVNQSFNPDDFNTNLDKTYGYKHNLLVLQYLNGDYDKVANKANNTNLALVNYVDGISLGDGKVTFGEQPDTGNNIDNNINNSAIGANTNRVARVFGESEYYEVDKDIDTVFRKQFKPGSFAATDEEIAERELETATNTIKGKNGLINIMKEFRAN